MMPQLCLFRWKKQLRENRSDIAKAVPIKGRLFGGGSKPPPYFLQRKHFCPALVLILPEAAHAAWYASLTRKERKKYDAEQALPGLIAAANRKIEIKDSIRAYKDSVRQSIPRILETFAVHDSLHFRGS